MSGGNSRLRWDRERGNNARRRAEAEGGAGWKKPESWSRRAARLRQSSSGVALRKETKYA